MDPAIRRNERGSCKRRGFCPSRGARRTTVVALWRACDLVTEANDPDRDIDRKIAVQPDLCLVGELEGRVVATVMVGYDGHRGWTNYLANSDIGTR